MKYDHAMHTYFIKSQRLSFNAIRMLPAAQTSLFEWIESTSLQNPEYQLFLKGEKFFYSGDYKQALKSYLQSHSFPLHKFYCYRASAYASYEAGELHKSYNYVQRALNVYSEDFPSLMLLEKLVLKNVAEKSENAETLIKMLEDQRDLVEAVKNEVVPMISNDLQNSTEKHHQIPYWPSDREFISWDCRENQVTQKLMRRLYCEAQIEIKGIFYIRPAYPHKDKPIPISSLPSRPPIEQVKRIIKPFLGIRLMKTTPFEEVDQETSIEKQASSPENTLIQSIHTFQKEQEDAIVQYRATYSSRTPLDNTLYALHGWRQEFNDPFPTLTTRSKSTAGGYFIRWNGKGVVINPGRNFLNYFHKQGLHIWDIDAIIVTRDHPDAYADIHEIYALNSKLNKNHSDIHVIHYYLAQKAYQALATQLKPHFKQERHSLHCLELFLDSPDIEKVELDENINLYYFPLSLPDASATQHYSSKEGKALPIYGSLGIKLELLHNASGTQDCQLGYISGAAWNPMISEHLGSCDVVIGGFGSTQDCDYQKQKHIEGCLGYFGTYSLLSEVTPRLLLCGEFSGTDGDIRLEVVKLLRQQYRQMPHSHIPAIHPLDLGMRINLKRLQIQCSLTKNWVDPHQIRAARTRDSFSTLNYLSPSCWS